MVNSVPMLPVFATDWFSNNIPIWERILSPLRGKPGVQFLEIGSWEGRSACWLLEHVITDPASMLTCIDTFALSPAQRTAISHTITPLPLDFDPEKRFEENIRAIGAEDRVITLKGESQDILRALPTAYYDGIYIDGSHASADVLTDAVLSWGLLKQGGILIFDDYNLSLSPDPLLHPKIAIDAFLENFSGRYELLEKGWQVILRKNTSPIM